MQRIAEPIRSLVLTTILNNPKMPYREIARLFSLSLSLVKLIAVEGKVNRRKSRAPKAVVNVQ